MSTVEIGPSQIVAARDDSPDEGIHQIHSMVDVESPGVAG